MGMILALKDGAGERTEEENSRAENNMNKNTDAGTSLHKERKSSQKIELVRIIRSDSKKLFGFDMAANKGFSEAYNQREEGTEKSDPLSY